MITHKLTTVDLQMRFIMNLFRSEGQVNMRITDFYFRKKVKYQFHGLIEKSIRINVMFFVKYAREDTSYTYQLIIVVKLFFL